MRFYFDEMRYQLALMIFIVANKICMAKARQNACRLTWRAAAVHDGKDCPWRQHIRDNALADICSMTCLIETSKHIVISASLVRNAA